MSNAREFETPNIIRKKDHGKSPSEIIASIRRFVCQAPENVGIPVVIADGLEIPAVIADDVGNPVVIADDVVNVENAEIEEEIFTKYLTGRDVSKKHANLYLDSTSASKFKQVLRGTDQDAIENGVQFNFDAADSKDVVWSLRFKNASDNKAGYVMNQWRKFCAKRGAVEGCLLRFRWNKDKYRARILLEADDRVNVHVQIPHFKVVAVGLHPVFTSGKQWNQISGLYVSDDTHSFAPASDLVSVEFKNCKLLLVDCRIRDPNMVLDLNTILEEGESVLIMSEGIEDEILTKLAAKWLSVRSPLKIIALKNIVFGGDGHSLDDVAALTGATVIRDGVEQRSEHLGSAATVCLTEASVLVRNGDGSTHDAVDKQVSLIQNSIEKLKKKIAYLRGGEALVQGVAVHGNEPSG